MELFKYIPHPHIEHRKLAAPAKVDDERIGLNGKIGLHITKITGTMWAAYLFFGLTLVSLPAAIESGSSLVIVSWIAQTFLQLVLLPIIIVGQNIQGAASDKRAVQTYQDAEAILHECMQLQAHLKAQDDALTTMLDHVSKLRGAV
jgi:hypothetical protein